jgi:hypothetical protein
MAIHQLRAGWPYCLGGKTTSQATPCHNGRLQPGRASAGCQSHRAELYAKNSDGMQIRAATPSDLAAVASCADHSVRLSSESRIGITGPRRVGSRDLRCRTGARLYLVLANSRLSVCRRSRRAAKTPSPGPGHPVAGIRREGGLRLCLRSVRLFTNGGIAGNLIFYRQRGYRETGRCDEGSFSRVFYSKETAPRWGDCPTAHPGP